MISYRKSAPNSLIWGISTFRKITSPNQEFPTFWIPAIRSKIPASNPWDIWICPETPSRWGRWTRLRSEICCSAKLRTALRSADKFSKEQKISDLDKRSRLCWRICSNWSYRTRMTSKSTSVASPRPSREKRGQIWWLFKPRKVKISNIRPKIWCFFENLAVISFFWVYKFLNERQILGFTKIKGG